MQHERDICDILSCAIYPKINLDQSTTQDGGVVRTVSASAALQRKKRK